ncbi:Sec-independent protein translocase protein TatB [Paraferrimonas haliotis]|uniref:Sec-independent protein translocase protein TatB n=1 Tax=Paraferrimonas haliotis TaxID=2013866 RepID=A0AA37TJE2_9GAMM|nr:Sec-independent protein translocase protein TatB [Paraferrimonas haliotis]GLS82289.1 Sec-independent protein translocase protein TatB [Paraferrimonas haliotis]
MFDGIGFMELLIIAILALVVLGPERLPSAVRSVSRFMSSMKRMANSVKTELESELKLEQLHSDLKQAENKGLKDLSPDLQNSIDELKQAAQSVNKPYQAQETASTDKTETPVSDDASAKAQTSASTDAPKEKE